MPAKQPKYKRRADYPEASDVVRIDPGGRRVAAPPLSPEDHDRVVRTGRGPARKARWREMSKLPPLDQRLAAAREEVTACREVLAATHGSRDASATAEYALRAAQARLVMLEQQGAA